MSIGIGTLISVIIFFLGVIFFILTLVKRPSKSSEASQAIGWDIVEEIKKNTEESINRLEKKNNEIDEKLKLISQKEEKIEQLYQKIVSEGKNSEIRMGAKKSPMDDKKLEIYRLHNQGLTPEKISKMLSIHKGIVETVLNLQEHERKAK